MGVHSKDLKEFQQARPFRPFRITLTDGRIFDVSHPELMMVGKTTAEVGIRSRGDADSVYDRAVKISLLHVMQIEALPDSAVG